MDGATLRLVRPGEEVAEETVTKGDRMQPGHIVIERLTGKRAIVVRREADDQVECRFADGRIETRYTFEFIDHVKLANMLFRFLALLFAPAIWVIAQME